MSVLTTSLSRLWRALRSLSGDDAYERYLEHLRRRHPERVPLETQTFYRAELDRRWSGPNRCC